MALSLLSRQKAPNPLACRSNVASMSSIEMLSNYDDNIFTRFWAITSQTFLARKLNFYVTCQNLVLKFSEDEAIKEQILAKASFIQKKSLEKIQTLMNIFGK